MSGVAGDRTNIWIHRQESDRAGMTGPLAGLTVGVKDNVDVAGMPTTAGCPSFSYRPAASATAVQRLQDAGAVVIGKTNLDQFATGLVGTRSPFGAVESPIAPGRISGGSSSGSAAAVALGSVDLAVGTDTAGSGRVPAALCGVVGLKGTRGWVPNTGVVPACPSFDCTTVFAGSVARAAAGLETMAGTEPADPTSRPRPPSARFADAKRLGVPVSAVLAVCDDGVRIGFETAVRAAQDLGFEVCEIDLAAYLEAGDLLYGGAFVAERHASVGEFVASAPDADPVVAAILGEASALTASSLAADRARLADLARRAAGTWESVDAVLTPTAPFHPTFADVAADPRGVNAALGRFVTGCNMVDWCAAAVPWAWPDRPPLGLQLLGPAWSDRALWRAAARLLGEDPPPADPGVLVAVVGAHLQGQPLNHQLTDRGAELVEATRSAPVYRMVVLPGEVAKPGLVRVDEGGGAVDVEVWLLDDAGFGSFVASIPPPLGIGTLMLDDGRGVMGFLCEEIAARDAEDITRFGGWRQWLTHTT